jgi:MerR family transcriptional regulator, light-induced transcriptional regulator
MASTADAAHSRTRMAARTRANLVAVTSGGSGTPASDRTARSLAAIVASEIIPRLMLAHSGDRRPAPAENGAALPADRFDAEAFAPLALAADAATLLARVEQLLEDGASVDGVMLDLLAPAARLLGRWWEDDRCSFIDVTMGLWRLQELLRELTSRYPAPGDAVGDRGNTALFTAFPGELHDFGAVMISEFFCRHGWDSEPLIGADMSGLLAAVGGRHYDLVGLTLSCDCPSASLRSAIRSLRSVSRNAHVFVIVGGRVLNERPSLAAEAAADGTASDARGALVLAERLMDALVPDAVPRA